MSGSTARTVTTRPRWDGDTETFIVANALTKNGVGAGGGADDNSAQGNHLVAQSGVRRLTPKECERLQGFPDDWTRWDANGNEAPDSRRYAAMGDAVTVNVAEWIAHRLRAVLAVEMI